MRFTSILGQISSNNSVPRKHNDSLSDPRVVKYPWWMKPLMKYVDVIIIPDLKPKIKVDSAFNFMEDYYVKLHTKAINKELLSDIRKIT